MRFDRDRFVALMKSELRLVESELGSFTLSESDMALLVA